MADYDFDKPVSITLDAVTYVVSNTRQASEILVFKWPLERSKSHAAARRALLIAMNARHDTKLIKQARKAFADAAAQAGILVQG